VSRLPGRFRRWVSKRDTSADVESEVVVAEAPPEPEREQPEPQAVVNERSARALLASGTPPLPPDRQKAAPRWVERTAEPTESETPAVTTSAPREWNIWELQRAVRAADDPDRHEEWSALFIHLREFANAEGDLPIEFDELVRESFAGVLERETAAS
jgi:hypothetical protein